MQKFWSIMQEVTIVPRKLVKWKHGSVSRKPGDSFSGTVPALTLMSWAMMRRNHEHW